MMPDDEGVTARLLQIAGPRADVPADRTARVRAAIRPQWIARTRQRRMRRRAAGTIAVLAAAAAVAIAIRIPGRTDVEVTPAAIPTPVAPLATVERTDGTLAAWLTRGAGVRSEWLTTGPSARMALRLEDGSSLRIDTTSHVRLISSSVVDLVSGAIYVDTAPGSGGLEVRTPAGIARDVGTQFEVRVVAASMRVRVRTGLVELRIGERSVPARPGTELTVANGDVASRPISAADAGWQWAARLAPAFEIEGRPLSAFVEHLAREQGWDIRYADAQLAREASGIMLHGSVSGLEPLDALAVALRTSGLAFERRQGEIVVSRPEARR